MSSSSKSDSHTQQVSIEALLCVSDEFAPWINASERYDVTRPHSGDGMDIVDCRHTERQRFIDDCGGLNILDKPILRRTPLINGSVPVIPRDLFQQPATIVPQKIVGINLKDILNKRATKNTGYYRIPVGMDINVHALEAPVFRGKQVVLFCGGIDTLLEHIWFRRSAINLYDKLCSMGFYAITGINFSLFIGECPFGQALNINKMLAFCYELDKRGVSVIPNIYAVNDFQRQRWATYLNAYRDVRQIVINQQLQRNPISIANEDTNIRFLLAHTSVSILLQGRRRPLPADLANSQRIHHASSGSLKRDVMYNKHLDRYFQKTLVGKEKLLPPRNRLGTSLSESV